MEEFVIDDRRRVVVKMEDGEYAVTIEEPNSDVKTVTLPGKRWAALLACEMDIDSSVDRLKAKQYVKFNNHIGGGYYVSVTTGFACVDIREFYFNKTLGEPRPTKHGVAVNLKQWSQLKDVNQLIALRFPKLAQTELCTHDNQYARLQCTECHPFKN